MATAKGGGVGGQSGAVRMGLSRAISRFNAELRPSLRKNGFLTRDSRMKERKKYGQKGCDPRGARLRDGGSQVLGRNRRSSDGADGSAGLWPVPYSCAAKITAGKLPARGCCVVGRA